MRTPLLLILFAAFTPLLARAQSICQKDTEYSTPQYADADFTEVNARLADLKVKKGTVQSVYQAVEAAAEKMNTAEDKRLNHDPQLAQKPGKVKAPKLVAPSEEAKPLMEARCVAEATTLRVIPSRKGFLVLSQSLGTPVDVEFFKLLQRTDDGWGFRAYQRQVTDYTACYDLKPDVFIPLYRDWENFRRVNSSFYRTPVDIEFGLLDKVLTEDTCMCGKAAEVKAFFNAFLKALPKSRSSKAVKKRLDAIKRGKSDLQYECSPN